MRASLTSRKSRAILTLWLMELSVMVLAVTTAAWLRFISDNDSSLLTFVHNAPYRTLLVALVTTLAMGACGLYQVHVRHNRTDFIQRILLSFLFGGIGLLVLYYVLPSAYIGRGVLSLSLLLGLVGVVTLRMVLARVFKSDVFKRRVLVYGAGKNADLVHSRLRRRADRQSFVIVGFVPAPGQQVLVPEELHVRTDCGLAELTQLLNVHEIVVAPDERRGALPMEDMLICAQRGVVVADLSTFVEREVGKVDLSVVDPSWLVFSGGFDNSLQRQVSKRVFDIFAATALLLVAWPFMLIVALAVWLESGLPILYRQTRVGEGGRHFELIKFRSMRADAEKDGVARWASKNDDRSTRVGRIIRATRLDELPQLFNVLCDEMSFVGPRPERPQFVEMLDREIRFYAIRHCVKPGLTGWAQLRYPYGASVRDAEEKLKFDLFYVKNHDLIFDAMILLQTVEVVLFRRGAR